MAKVNLFPDFRELFESLNANKVEYLVLGGYAVVHYGYERTTGDIDVWIAVDEANAARVSEVLQRWGGFSADKVPPAMFLEPNKVYAFGRKPVRVDILTGPSGVTFGDCFARRNNVVWDGVPIPLIGLEDLRTNKLASGRPKDLADLPYLLPVKPGDRQ